MKQLHMAAFLLLVAGGLNWLLVGLFQMDVVASLFGDMSAITKVVYVLVGAAAVFEVVTHKQSCRMCGTDSAATPAM
jgi:uncharacterized membrane protein YuzA (DUF378 family)